MSSVWSLSLVILIVVVVIFVSIVTVIVINVVIVVVSIVVVILIVVAVSDYASCHDWYCHLRAPTNKNNNKQQKNQATTINKQLK